MTSNQEILSLFIKPTTIPTTLNLSTSMEPPIIISPSPPKSEKPPLDKQWTEKSQKVLEETSTLKKQLEDQKKQWIQMTTTFQNEVKQVQEQLISAQHKIQLEKLNAKIESLAKENQKLSEEKEESKKHIEKLENDVRVTKQEAEEEKKIF